MAGLSDYPMIGVLRAEDLGRAKRFYSEVLGLIEAPSTEAGTAIFTAGDGSAVMLYERPGMAAPLNTTLGFTVPADRFDSAVAELRSKDVVFEEYELPDIGLTTTNGVAEMDGAKAAWFKDSEGNILNLTTG